MKKFTLLVILAFLMSATYAQRDGVAPLAKGELQLNFGTGFSNHGLPVYVSLDIALHKDITLTPEIHMVLPFADHAFGGGIMVKADYHWNYLIGIPNNWDFYAGARAGIGFRGNKDNGNDDNNGNDDYNNIYPELGIQVGGRWYWSEKWGLNAELAAGTGFGFTFGVSMKL